MTTFADLQAAVYTITGRPDLVAETQLAIQKATLKEHVAISYPRDLANTSVIALDNTAGNYRYTLSLVTLGILGKMRSINYIREILPTIPQANYSFLGYWGEIEFKEAKGDNIFDGFNMERNNYFIREGNNLILSATRLVSQIGIQYYTTPIIDPLTYSSWIADNYPYVIYDHAASIVFKMIGKDDEAATYTKSIASNRLDIIQNEVGELG